MLEGDAMCAKNPVNPILNAKRGCEAGRFARRRRDRNAAAFAATAFLGICFVVFLVVTRATSFAKTSAARDDALEAAKTCQNAPPAVPTGASLSAASRPDAPAASGASGTATRRDIAEAEASAPIRRTELPKAHPDVAATKVAAAPGRARADGFNPERTAVSEPAGSKDEPPSAAPVALEKIHARPRNLFPSLGISKKSLYVLGPEGHWARADEVVLVEVERLAATSGSGGKSGYVLDMQKIKTLKGREDPESEQQTFSISTDDGDPKKELGLDPKTASGRRFVFFLRNKGERSFEFFALTAEDFKSVEAEDTTK